MQPTVTKERKYVVINIGSSHITGMLSIKHNETLVQPIAVSRQPSGDNVKRGYIHNIDGAAKSIGLIIDELSAQIGENERISSVYVGLECVSMRSRTYRSHLSLASGGDIVTHDDLQTLRDQVKEASYEGYEVVRVLHPRFFVDGKPESRPQGVRCKRIEAVYQVITVRKNILENLRTTFADKLNLEVHETLITPVAEAMTFLSSQEGMLGCAYVNIGGGCTSVSLYKDRLLSGLYVLPMGGRDVTRDLESLALVPSYAEQIKLSKASMDIDVNPSEVLTIDGASHKLLEINRIVMARMVEVMLNVINVVEQVISADDAPSSWVFAGGGTRLGGFMERIERQMGQQVRRGGIRPEFVSGSVMESERTAYASELALTHLASKDCIELIYHDLGSLTADEPQHQEEVHKVQVEDLPIGIDSEEEPLGIDITTTEEIEEVTPPEKKETLVSKGASVLARLKWLKDGFIKMGDKISGVELDDDDE